jgi:hypothetical protein
LTAKVHAPADILRKKFRDKATVVSVFAHITLEWALGLVVPDRMLAVADEVIEWDWLRAG